jgi:hypothetical protein
MARESATRGDGLRRLGSMTSGMKNPAVYRYLIGAVGIEHDPQTTKSRGLMALQPPAKSNC